MDPKLSKWIKWLKIIETEIYELVLYKDVFWSVQDLIKKMKRSKNRAYFIVTLVIHMSHTF